MNRYIGAGIQECGAELPPSFEVFQAEAMAWGCDEVLVREWRPDTVLETHTHPFDAEAIVVQGELWLTEGDHTHYLMRGGTFRLAAGTPHAERYGPRGATYWVARRQLTRWLRDRRGVPEALSNSVSKIPIPGFASSGTVAEIRRREYFASDLDLKTYAPAAATI